MAEPKRGTNKKVVQVEVAKPSAEEEKASRAEVKAEADKRVREGTGWTASAEAKAGAKTKRIIAAVLWGVALVLEGVGIWYLLTQDVRTDWFLWAVIGLLVVLGILTVIGGQLWKAANQADPASRQEPVRFFVQNQLGAIIPVITFLPFVILLLLNKNVDGKTKGIAGAVGAVVLVAAVLLNIDYNPNSVEQETEGVIETEQAVEAANEGQVDEYTAIVTEITGADTVYWTPQGNVYHLCESVPELQQESQDEENNVIKSGTVETAHADGKVGLTKEVTEEITSCGFDLPANIDELETEVDNLRDDPTYGTTN
jgi:hypothetical protein